MQPPLNGGTLGGRRSEMSNPYAPPARIATAAEVVPKIKATRFLRLYAMSLIGAAAVFGAVATLRHMFSAGPGLQRYAAQFAFHDGLRRVAPLANAAAIVIALVFWAESQRPERLLRRRSKVLWQALLATLPGYLVASGIAIVAGLVLLIGVFRQPPSIGAFGAGIVTGWDFWIGTCSAVPDAIVLIALAHRYLARLSSLRSELAGKLLVALTVAACVHAGLAALIS
jgi:hypothetical protein